MRNRTLRIGALAAGVVLTAAWAPSLIASLSLQSGSRVWVEGSSTVRGWRCESTQATGTASATGEVGDLASLAGTVRGGEVVVPVSTLDCRNGTMNGHMRKALKAEEHPQIRFRMSSLAPGAEAGKVRMGGTLSIAGGEQPVSIDATVSRTDDGQVRVEGSKQIEMTDYGVRPPSLMMGTMRVRDAVTVHFDVVLK